MLETEDLFLAAYALTRGGGELVRVQVRALNGRRLAVFAIEGGGLEEAEREYWRGSAVVNLQLLKSHLRRLKDRAFDAVRQEERRRDVSGDEGGYRAAAFGESHRRAGR
ncbi:MAG: hypothetical protein MUF10_14935 [Thermoanaerobaculaceae bacterium]|nr:hypothetical protein [Thermoanaerobaculaceae bacterium]